MYFVYIVKSLKDGKFYTGITNDLLRRIGEHNKGGASTPSTLNRGPFILVHAEQAFTRGEARDREKFWKSGVGRELRSIIIK